LCACCWSSEDGVTATVRGTYICSMDEQSACCKENVKMSGVETVADTFTES